MKFEVLKEKLNDPREKAKIQLIIFLIFMVFAVIFVRLTASDSERKNNLNQLENVVVGIDENLNSVKNNYNYNITIDLVKKEGNINVSYGGIKYNDQMIISKKYNNINNYYANEGIYYVFDNNEYVLSSEEDVYNFVDYNYLNISNIKQYINIGIKDDNIYLVKVKDIKLDSDSKDYITIEVNSSDNEVELLIDYTNLLKDDDLISCKVKYVLTSINKITEDDIKYQKDIEKQKK